MKLDPHLKEDLKKYLREKMRAESEKARVISAYKLTVQDRSLIAKKFPILKNRDVIYEIDPELLAGVVIKLKSKIIDLSLKGRIKDLKNTLYELD